MNKQVQQILADLYALDPGFKKNEKQLIKLIEKLLAAKPNLKINPEFARTLRVQLMERAEELKAVTYVQTFNILNIFKRWVYPFAGGAIVTALIFVTIVTINSKMANAPQMAFKTDVTKLSDNAFGPLSGMSASEKGETVAAPSVSNGLGMAKSESAVSAPKIQATSDYADREMSVSDTTTTNQGGGSAGVSGSSAGSTGAGVSSPGSAGIDSKMIAPDYYGTQYKYVYNGKPAELTDEKVNVYRRKTNNINDSSLVRTAQSFGFGAIDLNGFNNLSVQNLSLSQDEKNGYVISLDFVGQAISIYQNWEKWAQPFDKCGEDQKCYEDLQLKPEDVPADAEIIKISDDFLNKYNADASVYGKPVVNRDWANQPIAYDLAVKSEAAYAQVYVPEQIQVTYPLLLDGLNTMDESGGAYGLNISVDVRQKSVSNVYNLRPNTFESSAYDAVTDFQDVLKYAEKGGNVYYYSQEGAKTVDVELGDPEKVMVVLWRPSSDNQNKYEEYFAPALKFPITKKPDEYFYRTSIIVPLAKEMLTQSENPIAVPMMR